MVEEWEKSGVVQEWKGPVGVLDQGRFEQLKSASKLWVGIGGIDALPRHLAKNLRVELDTWVAVVERQEDGSWRLFRDNMRRKRLSSEVQTDRAMSMLTSGCSWAGRVTLITSWLLTMGNARRG
eukprot:201553-Hanusia_phi.AAC.2